MRFLMMVKNDERVEAGVLPDEKVLSEMGAYNAELIKAGLVQAMDGLKPSREGTRIRLSNGKTTFIDGPFAEAKELLGGFWVISAQSKEEAIDWAKRVPFREGQVELRPLYEAEDFPLDPAEKAGGWRDQESKAREQAAAKPPARKPGTKRYMLLLKADPLTEAGAPPNETLLGEMGALMQEITDAGALLAGDGLKPSSQGARVLYSGAQRKVIDGPFTESKELIAGYSIVQTESKQQAIDWARRMLEIHVRGTGQQTGEVEVRELFEIEDFPVSPEEKPDGWRAIETAFRDRQQA